MRRELLDAIENVMEAKETAQQKWLTAARSTGNADGKSERGRY